MRDASASEVRAMFSRRAWNVRRRYDEFTHIAYPLSHLSFESEWTMMK